MNEEKWVLAQLKRHFSVLTKAERDTSEIYYTYEMANHVLAKIAQFEADSILGTPEIIEDTVEKLLDAGMPGGDAAPDPNEELLNFKEVK